MMTPVRWVGIREEGGGMRDDAQGREGGKGGGGLDSKLGSGGVLAGGGMF